MANKILMIEDDKELCEMFKMKFKKYGFELYIAENGLEGINKAIDYVLNVILLDIMMPEMNGFETLETLKNHTGIETKIIIFSNIRNKSHIDKAKNLGAYDFYVKADYTPGEVCEKIKKIVDNTDNKKLNGGNGKIKCPYCGNHININ